MDIKFIELAQQLNKKRPPFPGYHPTQAQSDRVRQWLDDVEKWALLHKEDPAFDYEEFKAIACE